MIDIQQVLKQLSAERPIFHSEADFQFALAWKIQENYPLAKIRLEKRISLNPKAIHVDIFVLLKEAIIAEIKYKTKFLNTFFNNEEFAVREHSAPDWGRWELAEAISRIEMALKNYPSTSGMAIFLTNDKSYWENPKRNMESADDQFRIHEGKTLTGTLQWRPNMASGKPPITLNGKYSLTWKDYSNLRAVNGEFRFLLVDVK